VVSRWLVTPSATICSAPIPASERACGRIRLTMDQISAASCSTQPGRGKYRRCSRWAIDTILPCRSKTMHRVDVVPWSMAAT